MSRERRVGPLCPRHGPVRGPAGYRVHLLVPRLAAQNATAPGPKRGEEDGMTKTKIGSITIRMVDGPGSNGPRWATYDRDRGGRLVHAAKTEREVIAWAMQNQQRRWSRG